MSDQDFEARLTWVLRRRAQRAAGPFDPAAVAEAAVSAARIRARRQRVRWLTLLAATLAVVVIAPTLVSRLSLRDAPSVGSAPTPTPTHSARPLPPFTSELDGGPYSIGPTQGFPIRVTFTAPATWASAGVDAAYAGIQRSGVELQFWIVDAVFASRCPPTTRIPVGPTVDDLVVALAAIDRVETTPPIDVAISGFRGKGIEVTVPEDACVGAGSPPALWTDEKGLYRYVRNAGIHELSIVDVGGTRLVIEASYPPRTSAELRNELDAAMNSIRVEP